MAALLLSLASLASAPLAPAGAQVGAAPSDEYAIRAALDPHTHRVAGHERIRWTNRSVRPVHQLFFHLYLNAFESGETVFMRESRGSLRGVRGGVGGKIEVKAMRLADGRDLLTGSSLSLGIEGDHTQMRVPLPEPLAPGETLEIEVVFLSTLPKLFARTGHHRDLHVVAQWFPKLARLEPDGRWASFPYRGNGEFYADFARYDLRVTLPSSFTLGATGERVSSVEVGELRVDRFVAERVHDTVFVASRWLRERRESRRGVEIIALHPPGYGHAVDRHLEVIRAGLDVYGELYGGYPYPTLTVVVPPRGAEGGSGMEYPTLFFTSTEWLPLEFTRLSGAEMTTAHELAHQWFQGLVASDEVEWPMLDEGLTTWASIDLLRRIHGRTRTGLSLPGLSVDYWEVARHWAFLVPGDPPPGRPAHAFEGREYARAIYSRAPLVLETVARCWGRERLERALGRYAREHRYGHPGPEDLFAAFDAVYWPGFSERVLRPALMDGVFAETRLYVPESLGGRSSTLEPRRVGALALPLRVRVRPRGGEPTLHLWPASDETAPDLPPGPWASVEVDPERANLLDPSRLDSASTLGHADSPAPRLLARALTFFTSLLSAFLP